MAPLPIVADLPVVPGLGFVDYSIALADAVRGGEPPQFTIGLYGPWGSGKSSLLAGIDAELAVDRDVVSVLFDAWRYERVEHIVAPLLHAVAREVDRLGDRNLSRHLTRALAAVVFSLNFKLHGIGIDMQALKQSLSEEQLTPLDDAFSLPFEELRKLPKELKGRRIAVLIDDLDRCSPDKVVDVLEAINLVMDVPGFIFVLALDYDVLVNAVATRYPYASGHDFVQKIIQLPFRVPPLVLGHSYLKELIPNWDQLTEHLPERADELIRDVASLGLRGNPRQTKRLINALLVILRIVRTKKQRVDEPFLCAMLGLQLGWPVHHQKLVDAILLQQADPFGVLEQTGDEADQHLVRYKQRFFSDELPSASELKTIVQLTRVLSSEEFDELLSRYSQIQGLPPKYLDPFKNQDPWRQHIGTTARDLPGEAP